ncbi:glutaredoxin family protein [Virgibacillus necropolis]|uniref:NrdH-redoxin n=1 Tax=Virgibacillus necropolis TaxID=163877 RepID=A0A221MHM2_9BACI|nr:glutaredoxin family protein [Virgibacillus necropolis]ASN07099.1 NrdH-redoxin [Virgibacillus necropolis]
MTRQKVVIYTSDNCSACKKVVERMNTWGVDYIEKNISNNGSYLKDLQDKGIFGTPATFVDDYSVLGFQESKLKYELSMIDSQDYFRNYYEEYDS